MNTIRQRLLFLIVAVASFTVVGWCQLNLGGITGRVTDPSGAAIPEAAVVLTSLDTGTVLTAGTSGDGLYSVSGAAPGRYRIKVTKTGFKVFTQEPIFISTATVITLDINLTVGTVTETVSVTAQAAELQTTSAEVGTVMPQQAMFDLPISLGGIATFGASGRRQIENFTFLTPGVQGNQWTRYVNGSPSFAQEILIDGFSAGGQFGPTGFIADATPPYEAVSEFKMQNTLYPAEYQNALGVESYTLKSGGSEYHGDLYEFLRNDKEDARGFFAQTKDILRQNEFGFTIGGPLSIPKVYNGKGKTFFFGAYSGFRLVGGVPGIRLVTIPTAQERNGDFSDYPYPIFDPVCGRGTPEAHRCSSTETRQQFNYQGTLNRIDPALLSGVALRTNALLPPPDFPAYVNNYVSRSHQPTDEDVESLKIDHTFNAKHRLSGALWENRATTTTNGSVAGPLSPAMGVWYWGAAGFRLNHTYTISPTLLNHIGYGYTWDVSGGMDHRHGNQVLQIPGIPMDAPGYPKLTFSGAGGYEDLGNATDTGWEPNIARAHHWGDDLTWVKGKHEIKIGGMYSIRKVEAGDYSGQGGSFTFDSNSTSQPNDPANFGTWGNSFASFLLGEVSYASRQIPAPIVYQSTQQYALYAEDSIKVTPKLTLTLGLRYEIPIYLRERNGNMSFLSLTAPNAAAGGRPGALIFLGKGPGRTGTFNMLGHYYKSFAPRTGLAYQINNKTVLRMGYGIFRLPTNVGLSIGCDYFFTGWCASPAFSTLDNGINPAFNLDSGFPATNIILPNLDPTQRNNGSIMYINGSSNKPSTTQSWSVGFQHELPFNILLDAAYVGSNSTGMPSNMENINQVNPSWLSLGSELAADVSCLGAGTCPKAAAAGVQSPYLGFSGSLSQALKPYPQYVSIVDDYQPTGYNTYHALQIRLQKRYSSGLSFLGAYTLSKNIGAVSELDIGATLLGGLTALDTFNRKREKSLLSQDQTHMLVFSWSYALPIGRGKKYLSNASGVVNHLLGGWQLNSIESYKSGIPIGITGGPDNIIVGNRPNWIGGGRSAVSMSNFDPAVDRYLDISSWSQPAPFTIGNGPRTQPNLRTPRNLDEAFSVFKRFNFGAESRYLEFRTETFNVFNRVVFGRPSSDVNDPASFGIIGSQTNTPRIIQFALKFIF